MASFDSIINVDEWISDYYLTNDEKKGESFASRAEAAVKQWRAEDKASGTQSSPWARLTTNRNQLQTALSTIDPDIPATITAAAEEVERVFGYPAPQEVAVERAGETITLSAAWDLARSAMFVRTSPLSDVEDISLIAPLSAVTRGGKPWDMPVTKLVTELFLAERPPAFIVLIAGTKVVLAERESWPLGRFLAIDVALAAERNDSKYRGELNLVVAALAREHIERAADNSTWWVETLEQSREHAVKVSETLREAIKESIEIIGNDVLRRHALQFARTHQGRKPEIAEIPFDGNELAKQALRYLYRILFLLFAEASPELNILPTGVPEYDEGYGLANLRNQILVEPPTDRAANGTYLYESLDLLFRLVDQGHDPDDKSNPMFDSSAEEGLTFRNLSADLFKTSAVSYIARTKLSNRALHRVLQNLLLTRETSGRERGYVSYATLGVTQLGQVYEGLMSFTGSIASQEMLEVAKNGDASKGSWLVTPALAETLPADSVVQKPDENGVRRNVSYQPGDFVFRQSSRDRERSASFYSPPVITEFVVSQAIEELAAAGRIDRADDILTLAACEPALGSGAFAVEAVNQLAKLYLDKKQEELGEQIDPEKLTEELQKVKAHIALHQVYGVDLNKTAVELAEISLWLDTMSAELKAPWFGLHLRQGNSLIGAERATFPADSLKTQAYLSEAPRHHSVTSVAEAIAADQPDPAIAGRVHHFLVPSAGWGAASSSEDLKEVAPAEAKAMKAWRKSVRRAFSAAEVKQLKALGERVEYLWKLALVRLQIAESQVSRSVSVWGQEPTHPAQVVERSQIEHELFENKDGAYQRLRLVMDAWNALWFWPLNEIESLPSKQEWLATLVDALGLKTVTTAHGKSNTASFGYDMHWDDLKFTEDFDFKTSGAVTYDDLLAAHPWLIVARQVAADQAFFHWDLDFAAVMSKGGFDLQVGNPPWVRPRTDVDALYSEHDPWFSLANKPTQEEKKEHRQHLANDDAVLATLSRGLSDSVVTSAVLGDVTRYPHLVGQQPDLYRGFMERTWANASDKGIISLVHPESHFTEKKAAQLRAGAYRRLRRHWQFINELVLFDVHDLVKYGIHVYGSRTDSPHFISATSLYHPKTVADSLRHDGTGPLPGFKDDNNNWDLRPHRDRIITVNTDTLKLWNSILEEPGTPLLESRTVYTVNTEAAAVLEKLAAAPRVKELGLQFSRGWDESIDKKKGYFDTSWQHPDSWNDVILQGPHLGVATPMIKQPNPTMKHNQDWSETDLEEIPADFIPATAYAPNRAGKPNYDRDYGTWTSDDGPVLVAKQFRVAWRQMAALTGFRTMYPAVIPAGTQHVNGVISAGQPELTTHYDQLPLLGAFLSSLLCDFQLRAIGSHLWPSIIERLPFAETSLRGALSLNYLRLNCLTSAYAPLWEEITGETWTVDTPLRNAKERWHAQNEIDAIVALSLGVSADELCMIYRTQFPVMRRYDHENLFDANGRRVASDVVKLEQNLKSGETLSAAQRTWTHPQSGITYTFEYPFAPLDREADLRAAYDRFGKEL